MNNMKNIELQHIAIYGPTASGKSNLAMEYAAKNGGIIVNFDSQQVYREIPIITAQPPQKDLQSFEHKLYGHVNYATQYNFNLWLKDVIAVIKDILNRKLPIIAVGGTGLYLNALLKGAILMPDLDEAEVFSLKNFYSEYETYKLHAKLMQLDPKYASTINKADRQRIFRALSFCEITGRRYSDFREEQNIKNPLLDGLNFYKIYIKPKRDVLYEAIDNRFEDMIQNGAIDEVEALYKKDPQQDFTKSTGVKEIVWYLKGEMSKDDMISRSQQLTRNYAKRQFTWFNNQVNADEVIESRV